MTARPTRTARHRQTPDRWTLGVTLALIALAAITALLGGCNTAQGLWRDVRGAAEGMTHELDGNGQHVPRYARPGN